MDGADAPFSQRVPPSQQTCQRHLGIAASLLGNNSSSAADHPGPGAGIQVFLNMPITTNENNVIEVRKKKIPPRA